jgi:hypothetical protein
MWRPCSGPRLHPLRLDVLPTNRNALTSVSLVPIPCIRRQQQPHRQYQVFCKNPASLLIAIASGDGRKRTRWMRGTAEPDHEDAITQLTNLNTRQTTLSLAHSSTRHTRATDTTIDHRETVHLTVSTDSRARSEVLLRILFERIAAIKIECGLQNPLGTVIWSLQAVSELAMSILR